MIRYSNLLRSSPVPVVRMLTASSPATGGSVKPASIASPRGRRDAFNPKKGNGIHLVAMYGSCLALSIIYWASMYFANASKVCGVLESGTGEEATQRFPEEFFEANVGRPRYLRAFRDFLICLDGFTENRAIYDFDFDSFQWMERPRFSQGGFSASLSPRAPNRDGVLLSVKLASSLTFNMRLEFSKKG